MRSDPPSLRRDRLLRLSTCRLALRQAGLETPEAVLEAPPELRRWYRHCFGEIVQLVERRHPDVMLALFWPEQAHGVDWQAAILGSGASIERLLSVDRGPIVGARENLVLVTYCIDDDGTAERAAWRALVRTLRASP
jgi:hypothetical protein